jgi:hypothetical protein
LTRPPNVTSDAGGSAWGRKAQERKCSTSRGGYGAADVERRGERSFRSSGGGEGEAASGWRDAGTPPPLRPGPMAAGSRAGFDPTHPQLTKCQSADGTHQPSLEPQVKKTVKASKTIPSQQTEGQTEGETSPPASTGDSVTLGRCAHRDRTAKVGAPENEGPGPASGTNYIG